MGRGNPPPFLNIMKKKNRAAQQLARLRHKKNPAPREFYVKISKLAAAARKKKREANETNNK